MGEITDKKGNALYIGDTIRIGNDENHLETEILNFVTANGGSELMADTEYGQFNVNIVEKVG